MVQEIPLCVMMASAKSCKRKTLEVSGCSEQVVVEADALDFSVEVVLDPASDASEISKDLQLLPVRTRPELRCRDIKKHADELEDEGDECCVTPKAKEQKIGEITTCPPPPRKPKSIPRKRNPLLDPRALFIPSDSPDLEAFFASHGGKNKKMKKM